MYATNPTPFGLTPPPFGLSLSKPSTELVEVASLRTAEPFDFAQGERFEGTVA
jgi:hypothetical protein